MVRVSVRLHHEHGPSFSDLVVTIGSAVPAAARCWAVGGVMDNDRGVMDRDGSVMDRYGGVIDRDGDVTGMIGLISHKDRDSITSLTRTTKQRALRNGDNLVNGAVAVGTLSIFVGRKKVGTN